MAAGDARRKIQNLHASRVNVIQHLLLDGEIVLDTGSARCERVPLRTPPGWNEDFGGFIVVTDQRIIYFDYVGPPFLIPTREINSLRKYSMPLPMTTGLEVRFENGQIWKFSGNSPFIKMLVKEGKRLPKPWYVRPNFGTVANPQPFKKPQETQESTHNVQDAFNAWAGPPSWIDEQQKPESRTPRFGHNPEPNKFKSPLAGWYPDPSNPQQKRFWDGTHWTDQVAPLQ
jgi:hypothetical protein